MIVEHHLEFLSLQGGCTGSSESTHVKMPHCWKSHVRAQIIFCNLLQGSYMQVCVKFKDFNERLTYGFQGLKINEKY